MTAEPDRIQLVIPAAPEYVLVVRLAAAGLATRAGLPYDDIEDIRVAVAEICRLLMGEKGATGTLILQFGVGDGGLEIDAVADVFPSPAVPGDDDLSVHLIAALANEHEVQLNGEGGRIRIVKRAR